MKAQVIRSFGGSSVFQVEDIPVPEVQPGHVLIHVKATSVNPIDTKVRSGLFPDVAAEFPVVLHGDVAGIVTEVGAGVTEFKPGDEVYGCAGGFKGAGGALGEYMLADARLIARKPENLTMAEAAAIPLVAITAYEALFDRAGIKAGDDILIHAAAGGVGHVAIQMAKWAGAKVYTTASTPEKQQMAKELGADVVINYKETSVQEYVEQFTNGKGFKYIFDTVGKENLDRSFQAAALHGTVVGVAARSTHDLTPLHSKGLSFHVVFMLLHMMNENERQQNKVRLNHISSIINEGKLHPVIDPKHFTFDDVSAAHQYLEDNKAIGKIVLVNEW
ncbi:zinc-dependent alcohol dehydrogenase family protein [Bacillus benzoevorans]|uniref:NADPH2:quinone reductase n=1 Tax=Bacillus benzoevorans TaxID=1456 RepID=A0A7X0LUR1_9BACI|nr:zinc-dependent alcohol dehydrogenase family protein [Bacillus benzoevorans]MBB6445226.1 NADPH2:quinone reductase [Bacillus benzoevorans]